ncbi:MAG: hypothetical protein FWD98_00455 [Defluviitaleaceae bacterium]|nr:hypothetical protein [Defluviitaleaceae bacterium]
MNNDSNMTDMLAMMSQMFGDGTPEQQDSLRQAMEMAHMFQAFSQAGQAQEAAPESFAADEPTPPHAEFYDAAILTPELVAIKSAIPHMDARYRRPLGLLVKMVEMQRLMAMYNTQPGVYAASSNAASPSADTRTRLMLSAIKSNTADPASRTKIDIMLKVMELADLVRGIN